MAKLASDVSMVVEKRMVLCLQYSQVGHEKRRKGKSFRHVGSIICFSNCKANSCSLFIRSSAIVKTIEHKPLPHRASMLGWYHEQSLIAVLMSENQSSSQGRLELRMAVALLWRKNDLLRSIVKLPCLTFEWNSCFSLLLLD